MSDPLPPTSGSTYGETPANGSAEGEGPSLAELRASLRRVTHDINNPLAIISGNAQLLLELARMLDLDPDIAKPIKDIEEASQQLAEMVRRLSALNDEAQRIG